MVALISGAPVRIDGPDGNAGRPSQAEQDVLIARTHAQPSPLDAAAKELESMKKSVDELLFAVGEAKEVSAYKQSGPNDALAESAMDEDLQAAKVATDVAFAMLYNVTDSLHTLETDAQDAFTSQKITLGDMLIELEQSGSSLAVPGIAGAPHAERSEPPWDSLDYDYANQQLVFNKIAYQKIQKQLKGEFKRLRQVNVSLRNRKTSLDKYTAMTKVDAADK